MHQWLWLIPFLPLAAFLFLTLARFALTRRMVAWVGIGSVAASTFIAYAILAQWISHPPPTAQTQVLWEWLAIGNLRAEIAFRLDALSALMIAVITLVSLLVLLYSSRYMIEEEGYARFFAYMDLFVGSMLILVMADNLLLLYLGWEGVGLCSYLLIGFWYQNLANGWAARKAFVVTRIGDTALLVGFLFLLTHLHSLNLQELMQRASFEWPLGSSSSWLATVAAGLILAGAIGKSAQLPLHVWLPDAMAGPTPVSALIHAATMVTAGVYLVARLHVLYSLAPPIQSALAIIGGATLLYGAFSALAQWDIKRVLAYSTMSQVGYMYLAFGVGAWSAGMFHFMTHAFFKSLLFLSAGVAILALHHESNMWKMGGLSRKYPLAFWTFLIATASLSAFPIITAGFYSKDQILFWAWHSPLGNGWLWAAALAGEFLTALYAFRAFFLIFMGAPSDDETRQPISLAMALSLIALAIFSVVSGLVEMPPGLGNTAHLSEFLQTVLPPPDVRPFRSEHNGLLQAAALAAPLLGILTAHRLFQRDRLRIDQRTGTPHASPWMRAWRAGFGFDGIYGFFLVRPFIWMTRSLQPDWIDSLCDGLAKSLQAVHAMLSRTENGRVRTYAIGIVLGAILILAIGIWT